MTTAHRTLPKLPEIGHSETYYKKLAQEAEHAGDRHAHEAAKVGQYITLSLDSQLSWNEKLKYFRHTLKRHCQPPPFPDDEVWMFYRQMADLVRQYAGQEALRTASTEDDMYAARVALGQSEERIREEAEVFFAHIMGTDASDSTAGGGEHCPEWFNESDWSQLKLLRDQWI